MMDATPSPDNPPAEPSSLLDRLTNVIVSPNEVFEEVKAAPVRTSNWLVPLVLVLLAGVLFGVIAFSQPGVLRSAAEQRERSMAKQVAAGKITQAQADQASTMMEKFFTPAVQKVLGIGFVNCASIFCLFVLSFGTWLGLRVCWKNPVTYMKIVEVSGLALVIDVPQKIVRTWLVSWKENMLVTVSPTLFLPNPDLTNKAHLFLSMIDLIDFWWLAILTLGISKVASVSFGKAAVLTCGIWFGLRIVATLLTPS
ncbi:MAG TPA: YIP1 family protein [Verrucomicrobiae bacterium]|jgi:hypothetical protein|nr:YIP1 family protein [Verrucomicrobiae bacterium]